MKPSQEFIPRKETDKPWVMGYYIMQSNGHVIEVEVQSKEAKEKYEQVSVSIYYLTNRKC